MLELSQSHSNPSMHTPSKYFCGCSLTDSEADDLLGIKQELIEEHGEDEAEGLYDGAYENLSMVLSGHLCGVWNLDEGLFIGAFLDSRTDESKITEIGQALRQTFPALDASKLSWFFPKYDQQGEVVGFSADSKK